MKTINLNANEYKIENVNGYTQGAWKGAKYNSSLSMTEICAIIRQAIKQQYPELKVSVTKRHYNAISISIMGSPYELFAKPSIENLPNRNTFNQTNEARLAEWQARIAKGNIGVNHYYIDEDYMINEKAKEIMKFINVMCVSYNRDDSDSQSDYFDTNFYYDLSIGKWDKPVNIIKTDYAQLTINSLKKVK